MYIVNKSKTQLLNLEQVTALYIGADDVSADDVSIKADFTTGNGCQVARYNSRAEATAAIEMLGRAIGRSEVFFFPDSKELQAKIQDGKQKVHHISGKKTKGHGGS